ncbi:MAG: serine/threonine protein kinase [Phycisphaerae bacterium]
MAVDIPNYRVVEKLGVGAQSRIFRARCMRSGRDYAVKIVKATTPEDFGVIDLLRTEHTIGTSVDHPVLRKVYELRMLRRRLRVYGAILFMEYVDGLSLGDKEYHTALDEILRVFVDTAQGLAAMHQAGYVHADLKPTNILITGDGTVKLIDLGQSAKIHQAKPRVQGTIDYMAPEQVHRGRILDQRTDVFGLGATLHKVLTGTPIRTGMNQTISLNSQSLVGKRMTDSAEPVTQRLSTAVVRLLADCCQDDPEARIPNMQVLTERLEFVRAAVERQANGGSGEEDEGDAGGMDVAGLRPPAAPAVATEDLGSAFEEFLQEDGEPADDGPDAAAGG